MEQDNDRVYEIPLDCNALEISFLTKTGNYYPAVTVDLDVKDFEKWIASGSPRFKLRFKHFDFAFSRAECSDRTLDAEGIGSSEASLAAS